MAPIPQGTALPSPRRRGDRLVALWAVALLALSSCGAREIPPVPHDDRPTVVVTDATGAKLTIHQPVRRIVTTVPGLTETVIALGMGSALVAVGEADTGIPEVARLSRIRVFPGISAEALAQYSPDLVLVDPTFSPRDIEPLRARFPVFASDSRSLDGLERTFRRLGEALGRKGDADRLVAELGLARVDASFRAREMSKGRPKPRALLLSEAEPLNVLGPGSLLDDMLRFCGVVNIAADIGRPSGALSSEKIRERAPDWILVAGGTFSDSLRTTWADVPAVKNGRIADATANDLVRAGPRTAKALRRLWNVLWGLLPPEALGKEER